MSQLVNLARPTPGDKDFYTRWNEIGPVGERSIDTKILIVDHRCRVTDDLLEGLPNLKCIVSANTAHTHLKFSRKKFPIKIISLKNDIGCPIRTSVAEHVFNLIFRLVRPLDTYGTRLHGKSITVVGPGKIGRQVIDIAAAFGMTVIIADENSKLENSWDTDFITFHTPEKVRVGTKEVLERFSGYVINTSRPSCIDEVALSKLLRSGQIKGAALDVVGTPSLFWGLNVVISDHIGGSTLEDRILTDEYMVRKTKAYLQEQNIELTPQPSSHLRS